ncbi:MAG: c-type cytochrome [Cyclobacteriaceae bacterium]|nr:c-type cytochrome [Cyclobacteriaceae bacterium]
MKLFCGCFCVWALTIVGCTTDVEPIKDRYAFEVPANFPVPHYTFQNNPVTADGFELGRILFYDGMLSRDGNISCSSCHQQHVAFADPLHRLSIGVDERVGTRNAPAIQNIAFKKFFFWDGGVNHVDFVPIAAILNPLEMDESLASVVAKLKADEKYRTRFEAAFKTDEINSQRMLHALAQFMNMMVSANSRYDRYIRNEGEQLSASELRGLAAFRHKCASCHATDLFTDDDFRNNGLDASFEKDTGRERITEFAGDRGKFKVPSLRNVALTKPYMHDGRFKTLEEVLNHYQSGVKDSETLDPILYSNGVLGIAMTEQERTDILSFLHTLTDESFIRDKRFSQPPN